MVMPNKNMDAKKALKRYKEWEEKKSIRKKTKKINQVDREIVQRNKVD